MAKTKKDSNSLIALFIILIIIALVIIYKYPQKQSDVKGISFMRTSVDRVMEVFR